MKRFLPFLISLIFMNSCESDYTVLTKEPITIEKEVPVYIEVEVPTPSGTPSEDVDIWVDSFVQVRATDGVDIVWVIDQSGSMNAHQEKLLLGIDAMMNALPADGWRIVMITTDPDDAVGVQEFPLIPGDNFEDAENMFNNLPRGSEEMGFDAIHDYIEYNPYAATWMRSDAALLVVFVSDEDDQSVILNDTHGFVSWYTGRRFGNVFLSSIVMREPGVSVCESSSYGSSSPGLEYMNATNMLFGTIIDICSPDWSPGMSEATTQIEPHDSIALTHTPIESTIRVFVDGTLNSDWLYVQTANSVEFLIVPPGGSLVEVGYVIDPTG